MIFRLRQPERELRESKGKLMKGNESKIPFISFHKFFRIQTFQRVMAEKNKKSLACRPSRSGLCSGGFFKQPRTVPAGPKAGVGSVSTNS
jgi:hypothetical protein